MSEIQPTREDAHMEIGVSFRHNPKIYSFVATGIRLSIGDKVLVRTEKGVDLGEVMELRGRVDDERAAQLMPVVRKATAEDLEHIAEQQEREKQALEICAEAIEQHGLPMKLIDANLSFDNTRLVFFFSADGRVDFRELVRDLARAFRMRIELRQIGVRDEAKLLGGLGPCGRRLCCKTFMRDFEPVGIRMAKDQGLALNPAKISGLCDRLMCCLLFEHNTYCALRDDLPKRGERVMTDHGPGTVREIALIKEELTIALDDGSEVRVRACRVWPVDGEPPPPEETSADTEGEPDAPGRTGSRATSSGRLPSSQSSAPAPPQAPEGPASEAGAEEEPSKSKRRRRSRKRRSEDEGPQTAAASPAQIQGAATSAERSEGAEGGQREDRRRSRRSRGRRSGSADQHAAQSRSARPQSHPPADAQASPASSGETGSSSRRQRRRRSRRKSGGQSERSEQSGQRSRDGGST